MELEDFQHYALPPLVYCGFEAKSWTLWEGESDGEIEGAIERVRDFKTGDPKGAGLSTRSRLVSSSPILLSGKGGYGVPFSVARVTLDLPEKGDQGR
jgi:hypothetical protein